MNLEYRSRDPYLFISNKDARFEDVLLYYEEIAAVLDEGATETASPDGTLHTTWQRNHTHMIITQTCETDDEHEYEDVVTLSVPIYDLRTYLENR